MRLLLILAMLVVGPVAIAGQEKQALDFSLKDLNGHRVHLSDYKGKVVLLNFWATWCPPCRAEMPDLIKLQSDYQGKGLQIIGIDYPAEPRALVRKVARRLKVNYPVLLGTDEIATRFDVTEVLPVTVIIDREGAVRGRIIGILEPEEFEEQVKPLLN